MARWRSTSHLYEIQGMVTDERGRERWHGLYQYRSSSEARGVMAHIVGMDDRALAKEGLLHYEDFRVRAPSEEAPANGRKKARRTAPEGRTEAPAAEARRTDHRGRKSDAGKRRRKARS